jgi:hypothetical protein
MRDGRDVGSTSKWGTAEPAGATHTAAIDADQVEGVLKVERKSGERRDRVDGRSAGTTGIHEQDALRVAVERRHDRDRQLRLCVIGMVVAKRNLHASAPHVASARLGMKSGPRARSGACPALRANGRDSD